ncbi:MAG: hypothetical protein NZ455_07515 [Bacteroidia bacterium]|nr:hypothetical protein [Bacteroidia bacterium]
MKCKYLQAKTLHKRNGFFRDPLREACEGRALARCEAPKRSVARSTPTRA